MEIPSPQASLDVSTITLDQLAEKFLHLSISDSTQTQEVTINHDSRSNTSLLSRLEIPSKVQLKDPVHFPLGLKNLASIYQDMISHLVQSEQEIPLVGAQRGLVLSITPEGGIIHWPGAWPDTSLTYPSHLVGRTLALLGWQNSSSGQHRSRF